MEFPQNPSGHRRRNLYVLVAVIVLAAVVALTAFALLRKTPNRNDEEIARLQQKLNKAEATVTQLQTSSTQDKRILLTTGDLDKYCGLTAPMRELCIKGIRTDEPNATETYQDASKGLFVQIPYNPVWSNTVFRLNPFDLESYQIDTNQTQERLGFGYLSLFEGGGVVRWYGITFLPQRNADAIIRSLQADATSTGLTGTPETKSVNGITYVEYDLQGFCERPSIEVVGNKMNYLLAPMCGSPAKTFPFLESIVKTIHLID